MKVRLAGIEFDSVVDGPGVRTTVFFQGCPHHCPGCHNPESQFALGGCEVEIDELVQLLKKAGNPVTFSGGEPMAQLTELVTILRELNRTDCWIYTGFDYEYIHSVLCARCFDKYVECLVDGKFELDKKSISCPYRGSTNQRLIDLRESFRCGVAKEWKPKQDFRPTI